MLLYNVTVGIDRDVEREWLDYMKLTYIPQMMNTGLFVEYKMFKILHDDNEETISYSVQYFIRTIQQFQQYLDIFAPVLVEHHRQRFINKHVVFQTLLEEVV